uniref:hypothetical protein n=1 Tax=Rickettsia endosymbiont of Oedothorax gibbosus TaxID=931099 RepID=UPI0020249F6F|nr:hypothetical protein [Rickettsia endosymbiont of Oedothorax gibbosus]
MQRKRDSEILRDLVLARMVKLDSKRGLAQYLSEQFDKNHDLDAIYRMMDKLQEQIPKIKELCFKNTLPLIPNKQVSLGGCLQ